MLAHREPVEEKRVAYSIAVTTRPIVAIVPDEPLQEAQRDGLGTLVNALLASRLTTAAILDAIDQWFFSTGGTPKRPMDTTDVEPVVLIGKPPEEA